MLIRPSVVRHIDSSHSRYREIAITKVRDDLLNYISDSKFVSRQGGQKVVVSMPVITLPKLKFAPNETAFGVGNGIDGNAGDILVPGDQPGGAGGPGNGGDGDEHGTGKFSLSREELALLLGEKLNLPNMQSKASGEVELIGHKYSGSVPAGPESLLIFKDTYLQALRRNVAEGTYNPENEDEQYINIYREDYRFRTQKPIVRPVHKAVLFFIRDASGSMEGERTNLAVTSSFWLELWLEHCYKGKLAKEYILHDHEAWEATEEEFRTTTSGGGTMMASALDLVNRKIQEKYNSNEWNIYVFHYGDGDVFGDDANETLKRIITMSSQDINMYGYTQTCTPRVNDFYSVLSGWLNLPNVRASGIGQKVRSVAVESHNGLAKAIKDLLV